MKTWACASALQEGIAHLRHYLDGLDKQDALVALDPAGCGAAEPLLAGLQGHFSTQNSKARYEYNTVIVSLYGYLERFLEEQIEEYLSVISGHVPIFDELPAAIRNSHLELSLELIRKADHQQYAGTVRPAEIIGRLNVCFSTPDRYALNMRAFTQHTANFRHSTLVATYARCGISDIGPALRQVEPFQQFLLQEDPERDVETYLRSGDEVVFARLDDLANRRNDVSHGTLSDELVSRDLLRELIEFIDAYAASLSLVVYERALPFLISKAVPLGAPITVIDHRIVCVNLPAGQVSVGDTLIAKTKDNGRPFKGGPIREIQQNRMPLQSVVGGAGVQIGMLVEFGARDNHEFFVLPATH